MQRIIHLQGIHFPVLRSDVQKVKGAIDEVDDEVTTILCHNACEVLKSWEARQKTHEGRQNTQMPFVYEATYMVLRGLHAYLSYLDNKDNDDTELLNARDIA